MTWIPEPIKHLLEVTHIKDGGREFSDSQEYTPNEHVSTEISLHLLKMDVELRVRPYTMEHLTRAGPEYTGVSDGSISVEIARR